LRDRDGGRRVYLTERGEKNPDVLSLEAIKIVLLILQRIKSGLISLSRWGCKLLSTPNLSFLFFISTPNLSFLFFILSPRRTWMAS
jgi:hypothetical protein